MNKNDQAKNKSRTFDWDQARKLITDVNEKLGKGSEISQEMRQRTWDHRAAQLAKTPIQESEGDRADLVLVQLGQEIYGLPVEYVYEIRLAYQVTNVPRVPEWVAGVTNLSGRILSVIDLRRFFDLPDSTNGNNIAAEASKTLPYLIVVGTPAMEIAMMVDNALGVEPILIGQMKDVTSTAHRIPVEYVQGVVEHKSEITLLNKNKAMLVVVLDLPALLADERLIILEEVL